MSSSRKRDTHTCCRAFLPVLPVVMTYRGSNPDLPHARHTLYLYTIAVVWIHWINKPEKEELKKNREQVISLEIVFRKLRTRVNFYNICTFTVLIICTKALKGHGDFPKIVISNCAIRSHGSVIRSHGLVIRSFEYDNPFSRIAIRSLE